ncbi:MAG: hypothetical protein DSM106950_11030 [Stigonema ocellatum SAG 48.90 = DSM 106950]|nr:hypothetical protein [Stigonema ocellatum SAG 48.90 = DSM 106950]
MKIFYVSHAETYGLVHLPHDRGINAEQSVVEGLSQTSARARIFTYVQATIHLPAWD